MNIQSFADLSLKPQILRAIESMGFTDATAVQTESIPLIRTGCDMFARSQTGTGKTVAFGIPAVESVDANLQQVQVLILSPTRELAQQCAVEIRKIAKYLSYINVAEVYGGADFRNQFRDLKKANIVVGTPGRIMDHMRRKSLLLGSLKMLVLDEADEMLKMGFKEDVETILQDTPESRQTVMFSATVPPEILKITREFQKDPVNVEVNAKQVVLNNIRQCYVQLPKNRKMDVLRLLFHCYKPQRVIIFANTKSMVDELTEQLKADGISIEGLHGDMKQNQRTTVMNSFKQGKTTILVATDVAARGIDVNDVDYVINYDIPQSTEYYVHRIGRTGRAGRKGTAITLCYEGHQVQTLRRLARETKSDMDELPIPTVADVQQQNRKHSVDLIRAAIDTPVDDSYHHIVSELIAEGYDASDIAAALIKKSYSQNINNLVDVKLSPKRRERKAADRPVKHRSEAGYTNITIDIGRSDRIAPNHIVGAITEAAGISSAMIGKIDISPHLTIVGIPSDIAGEVVDAMQGLKIQKKPVEVRVSDSAPRRSSDRYSRFGGKPKGKHEFNHSRAKAHKNKGR